MNLQSHPSRRLSGFMLLHLIWGFAFFSSFLFICAHFIGQRKKGIEKLNLTHVQLERASRGSGTPTGVLRDPENGLFYIEVLTDESSPLLLSRRPLRRNDMRTTPNSDVQREDWIDESDPRIQLPSRRIYQTHERIHFKFDFN